LRAHEAAGGAGFEPPAGRPVLLDCLRRRAPHEWIIALCGFAPRPGLGPLLRWRPQAPFTRAREATEERRGERRESRARSRRSEADAGPDRPRDRREERGGRPTGAARAPHAGGRALPL